MKRSVNYSRVLLLLVLIALVALTGCKSAVKIDENGQPVADFRDFKDKKIALVEVDTQRGGDTARKVVEVALVNELMKRGTFVLVSKEDIGKAKQDPSQDPMDFKGLALRSGAQASLRLTVIEFQSEEKSGYSEQEIEDSYLKKERGDEKSKRLYKVKALDSLVKYKIEMLDLTREPNPIFTDTIEKQKRIVADESKGTSARLPPRLRVLESLSQEAFTEFFDRVSQ